MDKVIMLQGKKSGPTVAIFAGVHGNERAGIMTLDYLINNLVVTRGIVYLVYANPRAIKQGVRYTEKNLNRCFLSTSSQGETYEEKRAVELMELLDTCDALLDLHSYNEPYGESTPFAICEKDCIEIVSNFDVPIVLTGIDQYEKGGSDGYMFNQGKIGICVELGAIEDPEKFVPLGIKTAYQFLNHFRLINELIADEDGSEQKILQVSGIYKKQNPDLRFTRELKTFDPLVKGEIICTDGDSVVRAREDSYVLFPRDDLPVGVEAFLTAKE